MSIDISAFSLINVLDTCSVWNILSSKLMFGSALQSKMHFSITQFVEYECLRKPRGNESKTDAELKTRLKKGISDGSIRVCSLSIADLQHIDVFEKRKRLGRGELSTIVFTRQISKSMVTDDQAARRFAEEILGREFVQTIPQLVGWLFFHGILTDSSLPEIIDEHNSFSRPLEKYFRQVYMTALEWRLKANANAHPQ